MEKLITFAVPCYNSAAYMDHCIETLLAAGEEAEIILVDDGSTKDDTPEKCDAWAERYPGIIRVIHQENGGHGEGVNQGIRHARGLTIRWWTRTTGWTPARWTRSWSTCAALPRCPPRWTW